MKKLLIISVMLILVIPAFLFADESEDSLAAVVDDLFMKASSGEVQFKDLVAPSKEALIEMGINAVPQMITKLGTEDARERHTVEAIFKGIGDPAVPALIEALNTENLYQLRLASSSLGKIKNKEATPDLLVLFMHANHTVRSSAVTAVGNIKDSAILSEIIDRLSDKTETVRKSAAVALGKIEHGDAIQALVLALDDPHFSVRYSSSGALIKIGETAGKYLLKNSDSLSDYGVQFACEIWTGLEYKKASKYLQNLSKSDDRYFRGFAIKALAGIDPKKANKLIKKYSKKESDLFVLSCYAEARNIISKTEE